MFHAQIMSDAGWFSGKSVFKRQIGVEHAGAVRAVVRRRRSRKNNADNEERPVVVVVSVIEMAVDFQFEKPRHLPRASLAGTRLLPNNSPVPIIIDANNI